MPGLFRQTDGGFECEKLLKSRQDQLLNSQQERAVAVREVIREAVLSVTWRMPGGKKSRIDSD